VSDVSEALKQNAEAADPQFYKTNAGPYTFPMLLRDYFAAQIPSPIHGRS